MIEKQQLKVTASRSCRLFFCLDFLVPALIVVAFILLIDARAIDLSISSYWHSNSEGWFSAKKLFFKLIYIFGPLPALAVSAFALYSFIRSYFSPRIEQFRKVFLYLILLMLLGPGLIVNTLLKGQWGRPRPRNIIEFGGQYEYEAPWQMDKSSPGQSFPSGHASMGFYFFAFAFLTRRRNLTTSLLAGTAAFLWGAIIGFVRIVQGGHFFTDILWAAICIWIVAAILYHVMGLGHALKQE